MINWILENWFLILAVVAVCVTAWTVVYTGFSGLSKNEQIAAIKEWLVYACLKAEEKFGSGTGQIKLRYVYDMFVTNFPWVAKLINFEKFSLLVDVALSELKEMLRTNQAISKIAEGE